MLTRKGAREDQLPAAHRRLHALLLQEQLPLTARLLDVLTALLVERHGLGRPGGSRRVAAQDRDP